MAMRVLLPLLAVVGIFGVGLLGATPGMGWIIGVALPYLAVLLFAAGLIYRVVGWAKIPVPFRIPTTCGQQKSLPWIRSQKLENPSSGLAAAGRMALEVLCFRSLLRNTKSQRADNGRLVYATQLTLWLAALIMHWALLIILIRHLRLFAQPVPGFVTFIEATDGFLRISMPTLFISSVLFLAAAAFLLTRRLADARLRYISLANDYFPLFLLLGIGLSGLFLRHFIRTDIVGVKEFALGLATFSPTVPEGIHPLFFAHLLMVAALLAYFPFSKLMHMAGVFLSPTRNLANTNRAIRHVNPWDYPVKVHSYAEYENELRDKLKAAGLPVETQESC
jgi:nitrate reductase gamma subunit